MPAARQRALSSGKAFAVTATMGSPANRPAVHDEGGRFKAVHSGHLAVHQDQVVVLGPNKRERLSPIAGRVHTAIEPLQNVDCDLLTLRIVFGQQD